jgi:DNA repair exonuclease SbcCD ATPase subunit
MRLRARNIGQETSEVSLAVTNREDLQRDISSLEQALAEAVQATEDAQRALDDLEGLRNEAAGRLQLAHQAAGSYAARLEERRKELAQAVVAELIASFERLDAARASTGDRVTEFEARAGRQVDVDPEPAELEQQWAELVDFVRARAQVRLDEELVEAAAASPGGYDIKKLPEHLQVIAHRRRRERMAAASRTKR